MDEKALTGKMRTAIKWAGVTEVAAKVVAPITTMVLARILTPEAFGVIATVTMIVGAAGLLADTGFQTYLIQHEFRDETHKIESVQVAFWTNVCVSFLLWIIIIQFRDDLATLVGNPGLGLVIAIASVQLPLNSCVSVQLALYRRHFDFKTLFLVRLVAVTTPLFVTIPLALVGFDYWSIVVGAICGALGNAVLVAIKSKWLPRAFYSVTLLKEMLAFSSWSLLETIVIWLVGWVDILIIGGALSAYYLGIYKTSISLVDAMLGTILGVTTPVLFSALSRLQNSDIQFESIFFRVQKAMAYCVLPVCAALYLYSDVATMVLLGSQWREAESILGVWALSSILTINYSSAVFRSKGKPQVSVLAHFLYLIMIIPACIIGLSGGFWMLVYLRAWVRVPFVILSLFFLKYVLAFPAEKMLPNVCRPAMLTLIVCGVALGLKQVSSAFSWSVFSIGLCMLVYFLLLAGFAKNDFKKIKPLFFQVRPKGETFV